MRVKDSLRGRAAAVAVAFVAGAAILGVHSHIAEETVSRSPAEPSE